MNPDFKTELFNEANRIRLAAGRRPFIWDDRLAASAQRHADLLSTEPNRGIHEGLMDRLLAAGFPATEEHSFLSRLGCYGGNFAEGEMISGQIPIELADVARLAEGPCGEPHHEDFFDPLVTRVGIGVAHGPICSPMVFDYGVLPEEYEGEKWPQPKPITPHNPWELNNA